VGQELTAPADSRSADHRVAPTADDTVRGTMIASGAKRLHRERVRRCAGAASPFTLARSCLGRLPTTAAQLLHEPNIRHVVMIVSSTAGITYEEQAAITANGTQKSRAWRSWRRSVRAMTSARDRPADRLTNLLPDREVQLLEARRLRLHPARRAAAATSAVDEIGHPVGFAQIHALPSRSDDTSGQTAADGPRRGSRGRRRRATTRAAGQ